MNATVPFGYLKRGVLWIKITCFFVCVCVWLSAYLSLRLEVLYAFELAESSRQPKAAVYHVEYNNRKEEPISFVAVVCYRPVSCSRPSRSQANGSPHFPSAVLRCGCARVISYIADRASFVGTICILVICYSHRSLWELISFARTSALYARTAM